VAMVGTRHAYAAAAAVRVSGASLATVTGSIVSEQDPIDDAADALWAQLGVVQLVATWQRATAEGPDVGDRVTSIVLPVPGGTPTTVTCDAICSGRSTSIGGGILRRSWQIAPRPFATGAVRRE
jgi:hypothetical protein